MRTWEHRRAACRAGTAEHPYVNNNVNNNNNNNVLHGQQTHEQAGAHSQGPRRVWRPAHRRCKRTSRAMRVRHQAAFSALLLFCVCMLAALSSSSAASSLTASSPAACAPKEALS